MLAQSWRSVSNRRATPGREHRGRKVLQSSRPGVFDVGEERPGLKLFRFRYLRQAHHGRGADSVLLQFVKGLEGGLVGELMGITEESRGLRAVVRKRSERVLELPWPNSDVLLNLNTPMDVPPPDRRPHRPQV